MQRQNTPVSNHSLRQPNQRPIADVLDSLTQQLHREREFPLVRLGERLDDGRIAVEFFDRGRYPDGVEPEYDFYLRDFRQALEWVQQVTPKSWITKRHIEVFATLVLRAFPEGSAA